VVALVVAVGAPVMLVVLVVVEATAWLLVVRELLDRATMVV
jgi:hypothetical protein